MPRDGTLREGDVLFQPGPIDPRIAKLNEAEELLLEHGWTQGTWRDPISGEICTGQALLIAYGYGDRMDSSTLNRLPVVKPILDAARTVTGRAYAEIERFNDDRGSPDMRPPTNFDTVRQVFALARKDILAGQYPRNSEAPARTLPQKTAVRSRVLATLCIVALLFAAVAQRHMG